MFSEKHLTVWLHTVIVVILFGACILGLSGCAKNIQLRMAEPMVAPAANGDLDPPKATFHKHWGIGHSSAVFAWENPSLPVKNRVNLKETAKYDVCIQLPENFECRRLQTLQGKVETLSASIESADKQLRENNQGANLLLPTEARKALIEQCETLQIQINARNIERTAKPSPALDGQIQSLLAQLNEKEGVLRKDDILREKVLSPSSVESLVNQIEEWRAELDKINARILALNLLVKNTNEPYPRIIRGIIDTYESTSFTEVGAIPFMVEDEYLDWIRNDKTVTIVSYDPNERPDEKIASIKRTGLPEYWPQKQLLVIELTDSKAAVPRNPQKGTSPTTHVNSQTYANCSASTYLGANGVVRTYLRSANNERTWVFGPDVNSPINLEVWTQDSKGNAVQKLYPSDAQEKVDQVYIRQIAGVEGESVNPIIEAAKRGKIVAITRLGNIRGQADPKTIQQIHQNEISKATAVGDAPEK